MNKEEMKRTAREFGADLVGVGSMDRFEGAPIQQDPAVSKNRIHRFDGNLTEKLNQKIPLGK